MGRVEERVSFLGRLGTYRYLDMDDVVAEALDFSKRWLRHAATGMGEKPRFSFDPFMPEAQAAGMGAV
jgi:UDP-galactopyranose mutase